VADVKGNVSIVCQGIDPKALARLNELLDKKDLELKQKVTEANEWAERYRDLSARLAAGSDSQLSQQAKALFQEGKFEEAGTLLDRLLAKQETLVDQVAANHFNRAELFSLQFQPAQAVLHYEKAHQ
jgi:tetratricopeptide (TPR) repeat protein